MDDWGSPRTRTGALESNVGCGGRMPPVTATSFSPAASATENQPAKVARRFPIVACGEALLIVLLFPLGFVYTGNPVLHDIQLAALAALGLAGWIWILRRPSVLPWSVTLSPLPLFVALVIASIASAYPSLSW